MRMCPNGTQFVGGSYASSANGARSVSSVDAALTLDRNVRPRLFLIATRRHRIKGHDELVYPPEALAFSGWPLRSVGKTTGSIGHFNIHRRSCARSVGHLLLRGLLARDLFVAQIIGRVQRSEERRVGKRG